MAYTEKMVAVDLEILDPVTRESTGAETVMTFYSDMVALYGKNPDGKEVTAVTATDCVWRSWRPGDTLGLIIDGRPGYYRIRSLEPYEMTVEE